MSAPLDPEWLATWEAMPAEARAHVCRLLTEEAAFEARYQQSTVADGIRGATSRAIAADHLAALLASLTPGGES